MPELIKPLNKFQRILVAKIMSIPPGQWVSYKDLADAVGSAPRGVASSLLSMRTTNHTGREMIDADGQYHPEREFVPWWRVRNNEGVMSVANSLWGEEEYKLRHARDAQYVAEGGTIRGGRALEAERYRLD